MNLFGVVKDHILIGGPNAVSGWGLLVMLVFSTGVQYAALKPGVDLGLFLLVLAGAALTGNGVYAINAVYDVEADKINKPRRPLPSGRMTKEHALRYAYGLMASGLAVAVVTALWKGTYLVIPLWAVFTALGIAYSRPPFKLKSRHIFGNFCFGAFCGLTFLIGKTLLGGSITILDWFSSFLLTVITIGGLITMKDFQDYEGDKLNNDVTLPVKVGQRKAAIISIGLMLLGWIILPDSVTYILNPAWRPSTNLIDYWELFEVIGSFAVYIVLYSFERRDHIVSGSYSRIIYYVVILYVAYLFIRRSIFPLDILTLIITNNWDRFISLAAYATIAAVVVLRSWKAEYDILKRK
jgi:4-hydroxybenzoate polyprenyltransferase